VTDAFTVQRSAAALKQELDRRRKEIERPEFIAGDPVQFPRRYTTRADVEIASFLAATIAWGRRDIIIRSAERMFARMGTSPQDFVMAGDYRKLKTGCVHRTFFESDLRYFCRGFNACYAKYGNLENVFVQGMAAGGSIWDGIGLFREAMAAANGGRRTKHIANPDVSACKRINLALRWLVRSGPVDVGIWKKIPAQALLIPLDVHVARTARALGLITRKSNDKKAVIELTEKLLIMNPHDPAGYDFALFSM
jgi:uncharacterized protein (TIGR02757 family)